MKIVLLDQDGVVCDSKYQVTTNQITETVREFIKKGGLIIPNSDTPRERLGSNVVDMLSFSPKHMICEKGANVFYKGNDLFLVDESWFEEASRMLARTFSSLSDNVYVGDSSSWVRNKRRFTPLKSVILLDGFRKSSIAFYALKTDKNGNLTIDEDWFYHVSEIVKSQIDFSNQKVWDINVKYGIVIVHDLATEKTLGYNFFRKKYPNDQFFMIGDGDIDVINCDHVVHCSVGNGLDFFKSQSEYVSEFNFTEGLVDILKWISLV